MLIVFNFSERYLSNMSNSEFRSHTKNIDGTEYGQPGTINIHGSEYGQPENNKRILE